MENSVEFTEADFVPALIAFIGGMVSGIFIVLPFKNGPISSPIYAGIYEEPAKIIGLILIAFKFPQWLQSKNKGAIFGGAAGLGGAEASKDVFTGLAGTISLVSIRSIHQVFDFGIVTPLFIRCREFY